MKISSVTLLNPYSKLPRNKKLYNKSNANLSKPIITYPKGLYFSANSIVNKKNSFEYKPIGFTKPIEHLVFNYENLEKFCELYAQKLNSQLMPIDKNDVINLINEIKKATNAEEKTIKEILYSLTLFSTYNSLSVFDEISKTEDISRYGLIYFHTDGNPPNFSSNACIDYIANRKNQLPFRIGNQSGLIIDGTILNQLEKFKNSNDPNETRTYQSLIRQINSGQIKILNPIGWDIKCSDKKYRSANFLSGTGHLKSLSIDIIKRIQKGEKLDDILYKNIEQEFTNLLCDDIDKEEIKIINFPNIDKSQEKSVDDIYQNLRINLFSADKIEKIIEKYISETCLESISKKDLQIALCKLLDEQSKVYSVNSLAYELNLLHKKINSELKTKGYDKNNTLYCIPDSSKSFGLINYMYKKVNEINNEAMVEINSSLSSPENNKKAKIILDDISASGLTQERFCAILRNKAPQINQAPLYYASLITCESALKQNSNPLNTSGTIYSKRIPDLGALYKIRCKISDLIGEEKEINDPRDFIKEYKKAYCKNKFQVITPQEAKLIEDVLFLGYASSGLSCAFPYMLPDNNNDLASLIFQNMLYRNVPEANKTLSVLKMQFPERLRIYEKITKEI